MQDETYEVAIRETKPLTAVQIKAQVNLIQEVMKAVMEKDVHYGIIPGTPKPTLYKPGSEKILSTFRIGVDPESEDLSTADEVRYRVRAKGFDQQTGNLLGVGIGECSSNEEKYKWRRPICDEEFNEAPEDRKRVVWKRGKEKNYQQKQIRTNPPDVANTILKMAKKRAQIDLTLTVTAASDIFDQDLEDMPDEMRESLTENGKKKDPIKEPQKKAGEKAKGPAPTGNGKELTAREKLILELAQYCPDPAKRAEVLKQISSFNTQEGKERYLGLKDISDPKTSEKWIGSALGKLRKRIEEEKPKAAAPKLPANCSKAPQDCEYSKFGEGGEVYCQDEKTPCAFIPAGGDDVPL